MTDFKRHAERLRDLDARIGSPICLEAADAIDQLLVLAKPVSEAGGETVPLEKYRTAVLSRERTILEMHDKSEAVIAGLNKQLTEQFELTTKLAAQLDAAIAKPASSPAGGGVLTEAEMVEKTAAALVVMARCNIPPDVQELLVAGNPDRHIPPGILKRVLAEADGRQVRHGALSQSTSGGRVGE